MSKMKEEAEKQESVPVLTHNSISMCNVPGEGWSLVKIRFNPVTGEVGPLEKKYTGELRAYCEEKFKIEVIMDNIFGNCETRHI